ncbi:hypothetical protein SEMRO_188_G081070.1 [Seminavis robusta]|uniref:Uncharacterized protein n=1 Tax=Seminavis robusta TaxID=568900 RepID=A0A9N8DK88_9STRA|nr:hypothetical protein SEMRO_188_G081070.1 [Seminavis robusta]|eukprot:Sro188_g081070.1 n/a (145) ;mRNA; f:9377-9811
MPPYNVQVTAVRNSVTAAAKDNEASAGQTVQYAMMAEPYSFYGNNNGNGDLFQGWSLVANTTQPSGVSFVPIGGPSIRYSQGHYYVLTGGDHVELLRTTNLHQWGHSPNSPPTNESINSLTLNFRLSSWRMQEKVISERGMLSS